MAKRANSRSTQKQENKTVPEKNSSYKNIVICSDGTGNTGVKGRGTNVFKMFEAIDLHGDMHTAEDHAGSEGLDGRVPQVAFYDDGVGTDRMKLFKIIGGAFGWGLSRNIKQLYAELTRVYDPGDRIFLFGFSRGAFTARTLAGLITECGVPDRNKFDSDAELRQAANDAYDAHRRQYRSLVQRFFQGDDKHASEQFRERYSADAPTTSKDEDPTRVSIEFIGVWDTVDAVGLPFDELASVFNWLIYQFKFPDYKLSPFVKHACQALAIDEERRTFKPRLWEEDETTPGRIEQVWFSGVHSNVGGGYPKQGMSLVPLYWMMMKARERGLRYIDSDLELFHARQNVHDKLYDSRAGAAFLYRYLPRDIDRFCRDHRTTPRIHISALERIVQGTQGYAPGNIPFKLEVVATNGERTTCRDVDDVIHRALKNDSSLLDSVRTAGPSRTLGYRGRLSGSRFRVFFDRTSCGVWRQGAVSISQHGGGECRTELRCRCSG